MEQHYRVVWEIDIFAQTPKEAAEKAWGHMRHPDSTANVFEVFDQDGGRTHVDLMED
jgi:hypothetical protein